MRKWKWFSFITGNNICLCSSFPALFWFGFIFLYVNMADRPPDRRSVQDFVRNIINAVTNLQTQTSQVEENRKREESSSAAFTALSDELNARFQIPRGASQGRRIATVTNSTIVPAATFNPRQNYFKSSKSPVENDGARIGLLHALISWQEWSLSWGRDIWSNSLYALQWQFSKSL